MILGFSLEKAEVHMADNLNFPYSAVMVVGPGSCGSRVMVTLQHSGPGELLSDRLNIGTCTSI